MGKKEFLKVRLTGARLQLMARVDHGAYRFEDPEFQTWVAARRTIA